MGWCLPAVLDRAALDRAGSGERIGVRRPEDGELLAEVGLASAAVLEAAIGEAEACRGVLAAESRELRAERLRSVAEGIGAREDEFAGLICAEAGKPMRLARGEVGRAMRTFELAAEEALRDWTEDFDFGRRSGRVERFPVGVCGFITPFNFPLNLVAHKVAPALAAGCPWVLKPAEKTPLSALLLAEVLDQVEPALPAGSWAVLPALPAEAGPLVDDRRIRHFSFTGSAKVGWELKRRAAHASVTLELGGNAAAVLAPDWRDLETALDRCAAGAFAYSGQVCISLQRLLVPDARLEEVVAGLVRRAEALRFGPLEDEATEIGPMITVEAAERVERWIADALREGALARCGGLREGAFVAPTVLTGVPRDACAWREEIFGPVVVVEGYTDVGEALARVNDSDFGLQAALFSEDDALIERAFRELEVGQLIVGDSTVFRVDEMPYGGVKRSGCGREGLRWAVDSMTEPRLLVRWKRV